jgi:pyridoxal phosphate enzyme (YggS family)
VTGDDASHRRAELVGSLAAVRARVADACVAAGRSAQEVTLIAVTKTYPAEDVAALAELGVFDVGESRDQEASAKAAAVRELVPDPDRLRWHFVGRLQSRKARSVAGYATAVHSVDRPELVERLSAAVASLERSALGVFVQVSLDGDPARGGVAMPDVPGLADQVASAAGLELLGLMAVAPMDAEPDVAFADLAACAARLRELHPDATAISAGMSGDLEAAIRHGATHVRVGTALLGRRSVDFG